MSPRASPSLGKLKTAGTAAPGKECDLQTARSQMLKMRVDSEIPSAKASKSFWQDALCAQAGLNAEHTALHFGAVCPTLRGRHSSWINMLHTAQVTNQ